MNGFVNGLASGLESSGGIQAGMDSLAGAVKKPAAPAFDPATSPAGLGVLPVDKLPATQDSNFHPFSDASHPFWDVMQAAAGSGQGAIPVAPQQPGGPIPGLQDGGPAPTSGQVRTAFLNGQPVKPVPAPDAAPPPHAAVRQAFLNGTRVEGHQQGGVIPDLMRPGPSQGIIPAGTAGQILTMDAGGIVPEGFSNPMGGATPPVTGKAAGLASGLAQGVVIGHDLRNAYLQRRAHKAAADFSTDAIGIDSQNPEQAPQDKASILTRAKGAVEGFFHHLHMGTLNDNHTPNSDQGVPDAQPPADTGANPAAGTPPTAAPPSPIPSAPVAGAGGGAPVPPAAGAAPAPAPTAQQTATGAAVKAAATNPLTKQGVPQATPAASGKPHSLTTDYWQDSQKKLVAAVRAAAMAGEDPSKVYESLTAMRTAHFQGQIVRNLGAAHVALMNGDQDAVKQALSNVNYYLPNGQGIKFRTATQQDVGAGAADSVGQLMYRNPFHGLYGHEKDPEYTSVNAQHIEALGAAALDPKTVQETILKSYTAQAQARKEDLTAQGAFMTGQGRAAWGQAQLQKSNIDARNETFNHYVEFSKGEANEAYARAQDAKAGATRKGTGPKIPMSAYQHAAAAAASAVDSLSLGYGTTAPAMVPQTGEDGQPVLDANGKPVMVPNMSPGAGKTVRDPSKVPTDFQGYSPDDKLQVQNLASHVAGANVDIAPNDAALIAAKIYAYKTGRRFDAQVGKVVNDGPETHRHMDPVHHKVVRDVIPEPAPSDIVNVWMGNSWRQIHMNANIADDNTQGINVEEPPAGGNPADNAPAVDSGPMNDDNQ